MLRRLLLIGSWIAAAGLTVDAAPAARPNIVFILADDLGYGDLGCYGQQRIRTPRLDRLASEGIRFTQFYAGSTVCAPSRCVLMQGLHTGHCRVRGNAGGTNAIAQSLRPGDVTVAAILQRAGYATGLVGKWGLGDVGAAEGGLPRRQGFGEFFGYLNQVHAHNYYPTHLWRNEAKVPLRNHVPQETALGAGKSDDKLEYSADLIAEEALGFIRRHRDGPFFLMFTPTIPHANNEAGPDGMEVPDLGGYTTENWPAAQKAHAAMITRLDRDVGRVLDLLDELGLSENTLVFFSSDNGPHREGGNDPGFNRSSGPLRGIKRDLYEGGIRVPAIVRWPGRTPRGAVSDARWWFADFLPTAAAAAGTRAPAGLDGRDVTPLLKGRGDSPSRAPFYWEFHEGGFQQAVRFGRWKAIRRGTAVELYDLEQDLSESYDLAERNPGVVRRAVRYLDRARRASPDWPIVGPGQGPTSPAVSAAR